MAHSGIKTRPAEPGELSVCQPPTLQLRDPWRRPSPAPVSVPSPGVAPTRLERKLSELVAPYSKLEMAELMSYYARKGGRL